MNLKILFIIAAVVTLVFGVLFILIPDQVYSWYGVNADMQLNYMGGLFGAALVAVGLIAWLARNAADSDARKAIVLSFFIADFIGFIIALVAQLHHIVNSLGWLTVGLYLFFSVTFGYFQFFKSKGSAG
jgi:nitrate reductase gamma subunit